MPGHRHNGTLGTQNSGEVRARSGYEIELRDAHNRPYQVARRVGEPPRALRSDRACRTRGVLLYRICTTTHLCRQWPARQRMVGVRSRVIVWFASVSANRTRPAWLPAGGSARTIHVSMVWMVAVARFADTLTGPMIWIRGGDTSTRLGQPFVWPIRRRWAGP